ncbi:MAG: LysR family transcriptional regulator [Hyphomicrobiales bacterium]|nr:LysR family transcriptional regulator [Hyphomicrobiales bacterium]
MVSPPRPKMPGLNSLRAFESAARHESFADAAIELSVTPGAIAQQVKSLEIWTGKKLFKRHSQGVELTALGVGTLSDFTTAFDALGEAVIKLRANAVPQEIRIAALPSIAQLWLSPKLPEVRAAMPDIIISLTALEKRPIMMREPFDLAVFYNERPIPEKTIAVGDDWIFPVCSPEIAVNLNRPEDLLDQVLLHDTAWSGDWKNWFYRFLPDQKLHVTGPAFSLYSLAVEEAKNSAGILMGHSTLIGEQLASGALVAPFDHKLDIKRSLTIEIAGHGVNTSVLQNIIEMLLLE